MSATVAPSATGAFSVSSRVPVFAASSLRRRTVETVAVVPDNENVEAVGTLMRSSGWSNETVMAAPSTEPLVASGAVSVIFSSAFENAAAALPSGSRKPSAPVAG